MTGLRLSKQMLWQQNLRNEWCILNLFIYLGLEIKRAGESPLLVSSAGGSINPLFSSLVQHSILVLDVPTFLIKKISVNSLVQLPTF